MSYRGLLKDRATLERNTATGVDAHNRPNVTWTTLATLVPCRFVPQKVGEALQSGDVVSVAGRVHFLKSQDVTEGDRFVLSGETYNIKGVSVIYSATKPHHLEAEVYLGQK